MRVFVFLLSPFLQAATIRIPHVQIQDEHLAVFLFRLSLKSGYLARSNPNQPTLAVVNHLEDILPDDLFDSAILPNLDTADGLLTIFRELIQVDGLELSSWFLNDIGDYFNSFGLTHLEEHGSVVEVPSDWSWGLVRQFFRIFQPSALIPWLWRNFQREMVAEGELGGVLLLNGNIPEQAQVASEIMEAMSWGELTLLDQMMGRRLDVKLSNFSTLEFAFIASVVRTMASIQDHSARLTCLSFILAHPSVLPHIDSNSLEYLVISLKCVGLTELAGIHYAPLRPQYFSVFKWRTIPGDLWQHWGVAHLTSMLEDEGWHEVTELQQVFDSVIWPYYFHLATLRTRALFLLNAAAHGQILLNPQQATLDLQYALFEFAFSHHRDVAALCRRLWPLEPATDPAFVRNLIRKEGPGAVPLGWVLTPGYENYPVMAQIIVINFLLLPALLPRLSCTRKSSLLPFLHRLGYLYDEVGLRPEVRAVLANHPDLFDWLFLKHGICLVVQETYLQHWVLAVAADKIPWQMNIVDDFLVESYDVIPDSVHELWWSEHGHL